MRDIPANETWCGAPARPIRTFMRETAWLSRSAGDKAAVSARLAEARHSLGKDEQG